MHEGMMNLKKGMVILLIYLRNVISKNIGARALCNFFWFTFCNGTRGLQSSAICE